MRATLLIAGHGAVGQGREAGFRLERAHGYQEALEPEFKLVGNSSLADRLPQGCPAGAVGSLLNIVANGLVIMLSNHRIALRYDSTTSVAEPFGR
jgi:hypothetical protein